VSCGYLTLLMCVSVFVHVHVRARVCLRVCMCGPGLWEGGCRSIHSIVCAYMQMVPTFVCRPPALAVALGPAPLRANSVNISRHIQIVSRHRASLLSIERPTSQEGPIDRRELFYSGSPHGTRGAVVIFSSWISCNWRIPNDPVARRNMRRLGGSSEPSPAYPALIPRLAPRNMF
jgi:hypothetical protein